MFKKLAIIGLTTALIGCGTSNRVLADNWINELLNPSPAGILTGLLHMSKPKPTQTIQYNHVKLQSRYINKKTKTTNTMMVRLIVYSVSSPNVHMMC